MITSKELSSLGAAPIVDEVIPPEAAALLAEATAAAEAAAPLASETTAKGMLVIGDGALADAPS